MTIEGTQPAAATLAAGGPLVRFDGLCLDAVDVPAAAVFWATVLNGSVTDLGSGRLQVDSARGRPENEIIRVVPTTQARTVKTRVHLDVRLTTAEPDELLRAGASILRRPGEDPWFVLADPEGNAFCAFPAADRQAPGIFEIVIDSHDALAQARWWQRLIGGRIVAEDEAAAITEAPGFPWDDMVFDRVPEPKRGKNRMHWHVDLLDDEPSALLELGATTVRRPDAGHAWWVLADPEGNEFCAHPPTWQRP